MKKPPYTLMELTWLVRESEDYTFLKRVNMVIVDYLDRYTYAQRKALNDMILFQYNQLTRQL